MDLKPDVCLVMLSSLVTELDQEIDVTMLNAPMIINLTQSLLVTKPKPVKLKTKKLNSAEIITVPLSVLLLLKCVKKDSKCVITDAPRKVIAKMVNANAYLDSMVPTAKEDYNQFPKFDLLKIYLN